MGRVSPALRGATASWDGDEAVFQLPRSSPFQVLPHPPPPTCSWLWTKAAPLRLHSQGPVLTAQTRCPASSDLGGGTGGRVSGRGQQKSFLTLEIPDHKASRTFLGKAPEAQAVTLHAQQLTRMAAKTRDATACTAVSR